MSRFLPEKYFSLGIDWGIFNHKNINEKGFPPGSTGRDLGECK
jgi:hypothetical protein